MKRPNRRFVVFTDKSGDVVGFSEVLRIRRKSNPLFRIWHDRENNTWTAEVVDPRLHPEKISAAHLPDIVWKCGYTKEELGEIVKIFDLYRPSREDVAQALGGVETKRVFISTAPRRQ